MAETLLDQVLAAVASERGGRFDRTHAVVGRLRQEYGGADLLDRLYADIPPDCPREVVADLFAFLATTAVHITHSTVETPPSR